MSFALIFIIIILGIFFLAVEFFFVPGATIVGIFGGLVIVAGIYLSYINLGTEVGHITLLASVAASAVIFYFGLKALNSKRVSLDSQVVGNVGNINLSEHLISIGDQGIAFGDIRPIGKARFNDVIFEVTSLDGYIDTDTPLVIISIKEDKVFVKPYEIETTTT